MERTCFNGTCKYQSSQPSKGEPSFGDSPGPLFSIYTDVAEDEDNKMVKHWNKDADGILIFTGLFSAAVAALLGVTVQDLRPNSQDKSVFYLGNIYDVLADPNATRASIPSPVATPPPFSPPRYAVWVNSLWFLSLVMSLSYALLATLLNQWARQYIRLTQPSRCSPEKRARMRAFFADGVDKMHVPWAVEGFPTLLHLSLFLFFGGLANFLFNVDHEVFICVASWIGLFLVVYGLITLLPLIRQDSPYYSPRSTPALAPAWFLYASLIVIAQQRGPGRNLEDRAKAVMASDVALWVYVWHSLACIRFFLPPSRRPGLVIPRIEGAFCAPGTLPVPDSQSSICSTSYVCCSALLCGLATVRMCERKKTLRGVIRSSESFPS